MKVLLFFRLLCLGIIFSADAAVVNRTIDDTLGDLVTGQRPVFLPARDDVWQGPSCVPCTIRPDPQKAFNGTFTAASNKIATSKGVVTIDFGFEGSVYVRSSRSGRSLMLSFRHCNMDILHTGQLRRPR